MSQSELVKVAKALRDELDMGSFTKEFTARRTYDATLRLEDTGTLQVDVAPLPSQPDRNTVGSIAWDNVLDVAVRYRFGPNEQDEDTGEIRDRHIDELVNFQEEIVRFLVNTPRLRSYDQAVLLADRIDNRAGPVRKHLAEWQQFTGIIRVTYRTETEIE